MPLAVVRITRTSTRCSRHGDFRSTEYRAVVIVPSRSSTQAKALVPRRDRPSFSQSRGISLLPSCTCGSSTRSMNESVQMDRSCFAPGAAETPLLARSTLASDWLHLWSGSTSSLSHTSYRISPTRIIPNGFDTLVFTGLREVFALRVCARWHREDLKRHGPYWDRRNISPKSRILCRTCRMRTHGIIEVTRA